MATDAIFDAAEVDDEIVYYHGRTQMIDSAGDHIPDTGSTYGTFGDKITPTWSATGVYVLTLNKPLALSRPVEILSVKLTPIYANVAQTIQSIQVGATNNTARTVTILTADNVEPGVPAAAAADLAIGDGFSYTVVTRNSLAAQ